MKGHGAIRGSRVSFLVASTLVLVALCHVAHAGDSATITNLTASPLAVAAGDRIDFSFTVTNVGTTTWDPIGTAFSPYPTPGGPIPYPDEGGNYYIQIEFFNLDAPSPFAESLLMSVPLPTALSPGQSENIQSYCYAPIDSGHWAAVFHPVVYWAYAFYGGMMHSPEQAFNECPRFEFDLGGLPNPTGPMITSWSETTPVPQTAHTTTALSYHGHVLFLLYTGSIYVGNVDPDGSIHDWMPTLGFPHPEENIKSAVIVGDRLVIPSWPTSMIGLLNNDGTVSEWTEGPGVTSPATGGRVGAVDGRRIYTLGGGYPQFQMVDMVETAELHPDGTLSEWQQTTSLVPGIGLFLPMAMVRDGYLYVFGGETGSGDLAYSSNIHRAEILENGLLGEWEYYGSLALPRPHSVFLIYGDALHIVGGGVHGYMTAEVESVLLSEFGMPGAVVRSEPLPTVRNQPAGTVVGRFGYILGGNTCAYGGCYPTDVLFSELGPETAARLEDAGPARLWLGLKNSDDQGTSFDVRALLNVNESPIAEGKALCVTGLTRNPLRAKEVAIAFGDISGGELAPGDVISVEYFARIGTNPDGTKCGGHNNAVGLRLYYDAVNRASSVGMGITPNPALENFMRLVGENFTLDLVAPTATQAKQRDSGPVNFANGNPWVEIGSWRRTVD